MTSTTPPAAGRTKGRVSGRALGCGFAALVLAAAAGALLTWYLRKDPHGPILDVAPLGDDLAMLRRGYAQQGYVHLLRWDPDASRIVWSEPLFGVEPDPALTVGEDAVLVRAREARGHAEVHAFALDGTFRWRGGRARQEAPDGNPPFAPHPLMLVGGVVFVPHASDPVEVVLLEADDGAEIARVELPAGEGGRALAAFGGGVVLTSGDGVLRAVDATGTQRELGAAAGGWCVLNGVLWVGTPQGLLRLRPGAAEAERVARGEAAIVACGGGAADRLLLADGRVLRVGEGAPDERGVVEGLRARPTGQRVGGRYLAIQGAVIDLDAPASVPIEGVDLRSAEIVESLNAEDFGVSSLLRAGEVLVNLATLERVRVPGLRGVRGDAQVLWAWTDEELLELDPQTLAPRRIAQQDRVRR